MLTYSFENIGNTPLYTYLYKCIKKDIATGRLASGERLPSKRSFARQLNISTITVENAYALLLTEGYIYSLPKKGYFVYDMNIRPDNTNADMPDTKDISVKNESSENTDIFADFSSNQTMPENFPFSIWTRLVREIMADQGELLLKNPPSGGIIELRQAIAEHLKAFRDMHISPAQVIVGAGTEYLYGLLIQLLDSGSIYALENPGYKKIGKIYEAHGVRCEYIPLDSFGMSVEALCKTQANIIHISPSHHFPTGITMPISRRYELLGWASREKHRYIIEDDYDSEFRLSGRPIPTLQSIDMSERVIYMNTFTKSLASTIRISYMVLPPHLLQRFYDRLGFYSCTVSNFEQYTLARFIRDGFYEKHINRMRNDYRKKRNLLLSAIENSPISSLVTISEEDAGLHFLMHVHTDLRAEEITANALRLGIRITSLEEYYVRDTSGDWACQDILPYAPPKKDKAPFASYVINYSSVETDKIKEAIQRLYTAITAPHRCS